MPPNTDLSGDPLDNEVDEAVRAWKENYIYDLSMEVMEQYALYEINLHQFYGFDPMDHLDVISKAALEYSTEYGKLLEEEGATIIKGQKVPWMSNMEQEVKTDVSTILKRGVSEGAIEDDLEVYFDEKKNHAKTVARTEIGRIQNVSTLRRLKSWGYTSVKVLDDEVKDSCPECKRANGQIWSIDFAMVNELEHPHCVRAFTAYTGSKAPIA